MTFRHRDRKERRSILQWASIALAIVANIVTIAYGAGAIQARLTEIEHRLTRIEASLINLY